MSVVKDSLSGLGLEAFNLCIACSGGLDSTVLLEAAVWTGLEPSILHINYQLRGESSEKDEAFVRALAEKHQLQIEVVRCPKELTKGKGINLQEAARKFRHELFRKFIQEDPNNRVLLAHHQDDQIETFFLQLARRSGIFGLGGMHPEKNGIIRPFLGLSKSDLKAFALENNMQWREDLSNRENKYKRNQLRNELIPELTASIPSLTESILLIQEGFRNEQEKIRAELGERLAFWEKHVEIPFPEWEKLSIEEQLLVCKRFNWPVWIIERINQLKTAELSSKIDKSALFRTKDGFSWSSGFPETSQWEFKIEEVEILPEVFTKWEIYLDASHTINRITQGFADKSDTIEPLGLKGKSTIYKLLKDQGIPEQWRSSYPVFRLGEDIIWVPGICISKKFLANPATPLKIKLHRT
ncbi:tRNA(Ile)-lysidine synthase [compost metagenome]